ncbi:hypothetical protein SAMN04488542_10575 [Fontibacillus panacisegetis]|uniref:Uncharacterized protein n=1 Tax=Fontibacillus panacisegetis TaxID=670482 RepID=A0A1G7HYM6_9BACL|nr:hypothetical protein [Fontibacillus panacisegetis]SDF05209.1 hypothetical protein SAMN04488542_10575 [Fontibacillus panacisegetis]
MKEWIALYAAIVSTAALIWNITLWALSKKVLRLRCSIINRFDIRDDECRPNSWNAVEYQIINRGDKPIKITYLGGTFFTPYGEGKFALSPNDFPKKIEAMDSITIFREAPDVFDDHLKEIYVEDSIGRRYSLSSRKIRKIKNHVKRMDEYLEH